MFSLTKSHKHPSQSATNVSNVKWYLCWRSSTVYVGTGTDAFVDGVVWVWDAYPFGKKYCGRRDTIPLTMRKWHRWEVLLIRKQSITEGSGSTTTWRVGRSSLWLMTAETTPYRPPNSRTGLSGAIQSWLTYCSSRSLSNVIGWWCSLTYGMRSN